MKGLPSGVMSWMPAQWRSSRKREMDGMSATAHSATV
jgi:hypothetical protein